MLDTDCGTIHLTHNPPYPQSAFTHNPPLPTIHLTHNPPLPTIRLYPQSTFTHNPPLSTIWVGQSNLLHPGWPSFLLTEWHFQVIDLIWAEELIFSPFLSTHSPTHWDEIHLENYFKKQYKGCCLVELGKFRWNGWFCADIKGQYRGDNWDNWPKLKVISPFLSTQRTLYYTTTGCYYYYYKIYQNLIALKSFGQQSNYQISSCRENMCLNDPENLISKSLSF